MPTRTPTRRTSDSMNFDEGAPCRPFTGEEATMLPNMSHAPMPFTARPANDAGRGIAPSAVRLRLLDAPNWTGDAAREIYQSRLAPWQVKKVTDFIRANLTETLRLSELAAISGLSPSHFGRAFKGSTGLPPHRWQLNMRIEQARAMLSDAGASLADIACATGFADQSHFTRVFSKIVGTSPGAWRRSQAA